MPSEPDRSLAAAERIHIERVLAEEGGNKTAAAKVLGTTRRTLQRKVKAWHDVRNQAIREV